MKKFLTVLLALSVVFTYTVGTAFAVTAPPEGDDTYTQVAAEAKINDAATAANDAVDLALKNAIACLLYTSDAADD